MKLPNPTASHSLYLGRTPGHHHTLGSVSVQSHSSKITKQCKREIVYKDNAQGNNKFKTITGDEYSVSGQHPKGYDNTDDLQCQVLNQEPSGLASTAIIISDTCGCRELKRK